MPMRQVLDAVKLVARTVMSGPKKERTSSHSSDTATRGVEPARRGGRTQYENSRSERGRHQRTIEVELVDELDSFPLVWRVGRRDVLVPGVELEGCEAVRDAAEAERSTWFGGLWCEDERTLFRRLWPTRVVARIRRFSRLQVRAGIVEELLKSCRRSRGLFKVAQRVLHPPAPPGIQDVAVDECARCWRCRRGTLACEARRGHAVERESVGFSGQRRRREGSGRHGRARGVSDAALLCCGGVSSNEASERNDVSERRRRAPQNKPHRLSISPREKRSAAPALAPSGRSRNAISPCSASGTTRDRLRYCASCRHTHAPLSYCSSAICTSSPASTAPAPAPAEAEPSVAARAAPAPADGASGLRPSLASSSRAADSG